MFHVKPAFFKSIFKTFCFTWNNFHILPKEFVSREIFLDSVLVLFHVEHFLPTLAMFHMKQFNKRYILNPSVSRETNSTFSLKISYLFPEQFHYRLCAFQTLPFHVKLLFLIFLYDSNISYFSQFSVSRETQNLIA